MTTLQTMLSVSLVAVGLSASSAPAFAQGPELNFAQAGALLQYSDAEIRILWSSLTAKEFDPAITNALVGELERSLLEAKRRVDRATALLPDSMSKLEGDLTKLREQIKAAEDTLRKLKTDIDVQTGAKADGEEEIDVAKGDDGEEPPPRVVDWELLKAGAGWLGEDLKEARASYAKLVSKLKAKNLDYPKKPKGERG